MVKGGSRVNGLGGRDYCIQHEYPVVKILLYHLISGTTFKENPQKRA